MTASISTTQVVAAVHVDVESIIIVDPSVNGTATPGAIGPAFEYARVRSPGDAAAGARTPNHPKWAMVDGNDDH